MTDAAGPASLPLVSCVCLTYRRPARDQSLLEESIEAFLRQTYPNKELIVLNDCPGQTLACDAPGVRVDNLASRCNSVGEKRNLAVDLARGDVILPWDDDDISLPWRLNVSVQRPGAADHHAPGVIWVARAGVMQREPIWCFAHVASAFTRRGFQQVGGYAAISCGEDLWFDTALWAEAQVSPFARPADHALPADGLFSLYRAGSSGNHLCRARNPFRWDEIGGRPIAQGHCTLRSHWRMDYVALTRRQLVVRQRAAEQQAGAESTILLVGNMPRGDDDPTVLRPFPLPDLGPAETPNAHLRRFRQDLEAVMLPGATHLLVPPQHAAWVERYPLVLAWRSLHTAFLPDLSRHGLMLALTM